MRIASDTFFRWRKVDIAWATGLFEGEGTIVLATTHRGSYKNLRILLAVEMTDKDVVERFASIASFGSIQLIKAKPSRKAKWKWFGSGDRAIKLLDCMMLHLGERRTGRARAAIAAYESYCRSGGVTGRRRGFVVNGKDTNGQLSATCS